MYKISPWHYYNIQLGIDDIKLAPDFCGGDSKDELKALDATKAITKISPNDVKNLIIKSNSGFEKDTLDPFKQNLEHLYVLCAASEVASEFLKNCTSLIGLYVSYNKVFKNIPSKFFCDAHSLKKLVINYTCISLDPGIFKGLNNLEELDLQENNITVLKTGMLCDLPNLQKLILARNKILSIDNDAFLENTCLAQIDLSNNVLTSWTTDSLPNNNSLKYLKLSHNKITNTVSFSNFSQLFQLSLDFNKIDKIDKNMFGESMIRLDYLALNNNAISEIDPEGFCLKSMRVLQLDHNRIHSLPEKMFEKTPELQKLTLDHNNFESIELAIFGPLHSLGNLVLSRSNLQNLTNTSQTGPEHLLTLHLDDNNLTKISKHIFSGFLGLATLELNNCKLECLEEDWCLGLDTLKQLNLSGNRIKALKCNMFKSLKSLKTMNLSGNLITAIDKGAFYNLSALSSLNLCDNRLEVVCDYMFEDLSGMRSLALGNNEITSLKNNSLCCLTNLIYLDVSENRITEIEDHFFANLKHLVTLDLGYNGLTNWPNLTQTCELGKLILSYNYLKEFDQEVFRVLTNLTQLHIDNNDITFFNPEVLEISALREFNFDDKKLDSDIVKRIQSAIQVRQIRRRASLRVEPREKCRKVNL